MWVDDLVRKLADPFTTCLIIGYHSESSPGRSTLNGNPERMTWIPPDQLRHRLSASPQTDIIVLLAALDQSNDIMSLLAEIHEVGNARSRVAVVSLSKLRRGFARRYMNQVRQSQLHTVQVDMADRIPIECNWLPRREAANVLELSGFEVVRQFPEVLFPWKLGPFSRTLNRWLTPLPLLRHLAVATVTIARHVPDHSARRADGSGGGESSMNRPSLSIVVPARNEAGNIDRILSEVPVMSARQELIFVEGNSTDGTWEVLQDRVNRAEHQFGMSVRAVQQTGRGKGDAVRLGFDLASGDVLMILDADLTVPARELPMFYEAIVTGRTEFANGSRLVYPQQREAMRFLNYVANKLFGLWFTFIIGQPIRDTLCGTKVLWRSNYVEIAANRSYFGELDPFGDFDLLFGAARLGLRIRDLPIHYHDRTYGSTNISRFRHGWLLAKMSLIGARRLVFQPVPQRTD